MVLIGFFFCVAALILLSFSIGMWIFSILFCNAAFDQKIEFKSFATVIIIALILADGYGWHLVYKHSPLSIVMTNYK